MKEKILITCFEPFGGESFNASAAVVAAMPEEIAGARAEKITLPVEFGRGAKLAIAAARKSRACLIVAFGEARARKAVTPELVAINHAYAAIPDNAGKMPRGESIDKGGAAAYFTPFPARRLAELIKEDGALSSLSYSAGAYVCNDLYYRLLHEFEGSGVRVLFIHVPRTESEAAYAETARAVAAALSKVLCEEADVENVKK